MFRIEGHLNLPTADQIALRFGLNNGGRVQQAINESIISYCKEGGYVPASPRRILEDSAISDLENGWVVWDTPYAHYQYMGIVYGPNFPIIQDGVLMGFYSPPSKSPTDRELTYDISQNPNAGPCWFERMKADHLRDIIDHAKAARRGE